MDFADNITGSISNGAYKLAFLSDAINEKHVSSSFSSANSSNDLSNSYDKNRKNKKKSKNKSKVEREKYKNIYQCLMHVVRFGMSKRFNINIGKMGFSQLYLTNILKETLFVTSSYSKISLEDIENVETSIFETGAVFESIKDIENKIKERKLETTKKETNKNKEERKTEIITIAYGFVIELINICEKKQDITRYLPGIIAASENINLNILTVEQRRALLNILGTKRTLFLRILLLLTYELYYIGDMNFSSDPYWLFHFISSSPYNNLSLFSSLISSPVVELTLALTMQYF